MKLADLSIDRPVLTLVVFIALLFMGVAGYLAMGIDLLPAVEFPSITVSSTLTGAGPDVMERTVTKLIENEVATISGVTSVSSTSSFGASSISVQFNLSKDINQAMQEVQAAVNKARMNLPSGMDAPNVSRFNTSNMPIIHLAFRSDGDYWTLARWLKNEVVDDLERLPGVGAVQTLGLRNRAFRIWLQPEALKARSLTALDVSAAVSAQHVGLPAGKSEGDQRSVSIRVYGEFENAEELGMLALASGDKPVRLKDVASVEAGLEDPVTFVRFNGKSAISLGIQKQSGANAVEVSRAIREHLPELMKSAPPGVDVQVAYDQSGFIIENITGVKADIIFGAILTVLVMFLFLHSPRATLVTSLALPASLISTFSVMNALGFTLNNFTMLALSLSVGMVIDDAIVVVENVFRHLEEGKNPVQSARLAMDEIGFAVLVSTVSVIAVFLPIAFMEGIIGKFFYQFGVTVSLALGFSLLVALTLTPMLASRLITTAHEPHNGKSGAEFRFWILNAIATALLFLFVRWIAGEWKSAVFVVFSMILFGLVRNRFEAWFSAAERFYGRVLVVTMRHKFLTLFVSFALFVLSLFVAASPLIVKEMERHADQGQFMVNFETPEGTSLRETERIVKIMEERITAHPEVKGAFLLGGTGGASSGMAFINMTDHDRRTMTQDEFMEVVRGELNAIPGVVAYVNRISSIPTGEGDDGGAEISYRIQGPDVFQLARYSDEIMSRMRAAGGFVDVRSDLKLASPRVEVTIDRDRAEMLGVDAASLTRAIGVMMGGAPVAYISGEDGRFPIILQAEGGFNETPGNIPRVIVRAASGEVIDLADIIRVRESAGPSSIKRTDRRNSATIQANLSGLTASDGALKLKGIVEDVLAKDPDYRPAAAGSAKQMQDTALGMAKALILAILVVYLVLAAQFESFVHPFTIMTALPLALTGVFLGLALTRFSLDMYSAIGIVMLVGIATKNGILLVDCANALRAQGMSRDEALLKAGPLRMRPVMMTAVAAMAGMVPVALAFSAGGETRASMGVAVFGGLFSSTPLTLLVIPAVYALVDDLLTKGKTLFGRFFG